MRIALVTETWLPKVDGIVNTLCRLLEHLGERGHEALVFAPAGGPRRYAGARVLPLPGFSLPLYPEFRLVPPLVSLHRQLEHFGPELVHVLNPLSLGLAALRDARALGLPTVASYHTDLPGFLSRWGLGLAGEPIHSYLRWLHNQADLNLVPSTVTRDLLRSRGYRSLSVWGRGVDTVRFDPAKRDPTWPQQLFGAGAAGPVLLYVGRLSPEKRVEWLRRTIADLPEARLVIVGDGPARPALERLFDGTSTAFTGYLTGEELAVAFASADLFTFPAANETLGNVVLEAMASGLPVVAPGAGGLLDHVRHHRTGLLVDSEDTAAFSRAVRRLARDPHTARTLGAAGRRHASRYGWDTVLDGLVAHYARVACPISLPRAA